MRILAACPECRMQYDASAREPGTAFRCACGGKVVVSPAAALRRAAGDAVVVRCSSCGAPRIAAAAACHFCGSDFTVREQDLNTLCPGCFLRAGDRSRFCHHCGLALLPSPPTAPDLRGCPACSGRPPLRGRTIAGLGRVALECARCGGLWLGDDLLRDLVKGQGTLPEGFTGPLPRARLERNRPGVPLYRPCPECGKLMNRRNYGQGSGVILDVCRDHGLWFDADELARVLAWTRAGGDDQAARRARTEQLATARRDRDRRDQGTPGDDGNGSEDWLVDALWRLCRLLI